VPVLFLQEVNASLDKESLALFKDALKNYKMGIVADIDVFIDQILNAFFKQTLKVAMSDEKIIAILKEMIKPIENFAVLQRLALDVAVYIAKKQRARFYTVLTMFISKYEQLYPESSKPGVKASTTAVSKPNFEVPQSVMPVPLNHEEDTSIKCCICYEAK